MASLAPLPRPITVTEAALDVPSVAGNPTSPQTSCLQELLQHAAGALCPLTQRSSTRQNLRSCLEWSDLEPMGLSCFWVWRCLAISGLVLGHSPRLPYYSGKRRQQRRHLQGGVRPSTHLKRHSHTVATQGTSEWPVH